MSSETDVVLADTVRESAAYTVVPVPMWVRVTKAAIPLLVALLLAVSVTVNHYEKGTLGDNFFVPVVVLAIGGWIARKLFSEAERKELTATAVPLPLTWRLKQAGLYLGATLAVCGLLWWYQHEHDQLREYWWYVWPIALLGLFSVGYVLMRTHDQVLSAEAKLYSARQKQDEAAVTSANELKYERFFQNWWVRYPVGGLLVWAAYQVAQSPRLGSWIFAALLFLIAAVYVRELTLVLLGLGAVYLIYQGVAALPVGVAVIIGAIIIASAMRR